MADQTVAIDATPRSGGLLDLPADRRARRAGGDRNAGHQHPAAVAAADGGVAAGVDRRGDGVDHRVPRGIRARPARGRADLRSLRPALAGAGGLCGVLRRQHLVRPRHRPAEPADRPRHPGRRRLLDLGAVARHRPRPVHRPGARPRHGADHDRDGGGARLLAAARRRARSCFRLALRIRLCRRSSPCSARSPTPRCSARPIMRRGRRSIRWRSPRTISA